MDPNIIIRIIIIIFLKEHGITTFSHIFYHTAVSFTLTTTSTAYGATGYFTTG